MSKSVICYHPPNRLYAWFARDRTLCIACCCCGKVLRGAIDKSLNVNKKRRKRWLKSKVGGN